MPGGLVAGGWWLVAGGWWLVAGGWWLVAGGWWLVAGLVAGGWWLVAGGWWLVAGVLHPSRRPDGAHQQKKPYNRKKSIAFLWRIKKKHYLCNVIETQNDYQAAGLAKAGKLRSLQE